MDSRVESMLKFMTEEGFRPTQDDDGDIVFKYEGDTYLVVFKENDDDFVSLRKFISLEFKDEDLLEVLKILNQVNLVYVAGKGALSGDEDKVLILMVDSMGHIKDFQKNFQRFLTIMQQMERDFVKDFVNHKDSD